MFGSVPTYGERGKSGVGCGVHRTYVGSVERGEYNVTVLTLRKLASALRVSLRDALRGVS